MTTEDGMVLHASGKLEERKHHWTMYERSGIDKQLETILELDSTQYCIYGYCRYNEREFLQVLFTGCWELKENYKACNYAMEACGVTVERGFKDIKLVWTLIDFMRKLHVKGAPVGTLSIDGKLLMNFRNCFYRNTIAKLFGHKPPSFCSTMARGLPCPSPY